MRCHGMMRERRNRRSWWNKARIEEGKEKMMKKRVVGVIVLLLLVFCGCKETQAEKEVIEEAKLKVTGPVEEEVKTEALRIVFEVYGDEVTKEDEEETINKLQKRIESEGIENYDVYRNADGRIFVDIPDVTDVNILPEDIGKKGAICFVLREEIILEGEDIQTAENSGAQFNGAIEHVVVLNFTENGTEKFARITEANIGETISIVYDGEVICAPIIQQAITDGKAIISGGLTEEAAEHLATVIRIGELPLNLREFSREVVEIK